MEALEARLDGLAALQLALTLVLALAFGVWAWDAARKVRLALCRVVFHVRRLQDRADALEEEVRLLKAPGAVPGGRASRGLGWPGRCPGPDEPTRLPAPNKEEDSRG